MYKTVFYLSLAWLTNAQANNHENDTMMNGKHGFETLCIACHNATSTGANRLAPPMFAILNHYINEKTSLNEFVNEVVDFVIKPSDGKSKMPGAIRNFGLMPEMGYGTEQITSIATYLYQNKASIKQPTGHNTQQPIQKTVNQSSYLSQGKKLALAAKAILGKNLMTALNTSGPEGALSFCNENAIQLTEGVVSNNQVTIKRVSDLNRNPNNHANEQQLAYIKNTKEKLSLQLPIEAQLIETNDTMVAYYPITTNTMCLQCHGVPNQDIKTTTLQKITELYPDDKAIGYRDNQLRGIWVIEMAKQQANNKQ